MIIKSKGWNRLDNKFEEQILVANGFEASHVISHIKYDEMLGLAKILNSLDQVIDLDSPIEILPDKDFIIEKYATS